MATRTSTQSGNWNDAATWGGAAAPGDGDIAVIATGHTVTVTADATVGSKASGVGHAVQIQATDGTTYGKLVVNDGVTLTLKGFGTSSNTLMQIDRYALFAPDPGAIIVGDVASDFGACIRNKGRFKAIGTLAKPITFTVPSANVNWNSDVTSQAATCQPYWKTANLGIAMTGSPHISNAAGNGPGSFGDSSITVNSSSASLTTEVATLALVDGAGKYWVNYDAGLVYFYSASMAGLSLNLTYKKLDKASGTWKGWGIVSDGNTTYNTCLVDHCDFRYMGAYGNGVLGSNGERQSAPVNVLGHQTAAAAGSTSRLAYVKNSIFNYGYRWVGFFRVTGASGDPILITGNTFSEAAGGTIWESIGTYYTNASDYVKIDANLFNTRGTGINLAFLLENVSHLEISNNTGRCGISFIGAGIYGAHAEGLYLNEVVPVGYTPSLHVHDNVIHGISACVDGRFLFCSGTNSGPAIVEDNEIGFCNRIGHLQASFVTYRRNQFIYPYHHGFTGQGTDGLHCRTIRFENNLWLNDDLSGSAAISLGYNHRGFVDDLQIVNETCVGWLHGLLDFNDYPDFNGPTAASNIVCANNVIVGGSYAFANYTSATIPQCLHVPECDHNLAYGQGTAFALNLANTTKGTGFWRSGAKYNRETSSTRNLPFVALFDANYTTNQSARTLTHTVTTLGQDHTLAWGGGTPVQLVYDYGTSAGGGYRTLAVASKSDWITNRNSVRPNWVWVVSGTGAGQVRRIVWTSTYTAHTVSIVNGGTGYSVGQLIFINGGTKDTPGANALMKVTGVSSGAITSAEIFSGGGYTATPSNPCTTTRATGTAGGSCTVDVTWDTGVMVTPDLTTPVDNTSVVAIVEGMVTLGDSGSGTVKAGLYLPTSIDDWNTTQMGTTTQSDTGITVEVDNTLYVDPVFVASGAVPDYYKLQSGSPAIDAGTSDDAAAADYFGTARPAGGGVDMGFFELSGQSPVPAIYHQFRRRAVA